MSDNIINISKNSDKNHIPNNFYLKKLNLKKFRNHFNLNLVLPNSSVLIYGENGCGKTNILEAISLLNPGKVYPILRKCAEEGRVHVHGGKTKFPDIPRF
jgi:predicted ATPase